MTRTVIAASGPARPCHRLSAHRHVRSTASRPSLVGNGGWMVGQGPGGLANPFPMRTRLLPSDAAAVDVALGRGKETPQYCLDQPDQRDGTGRHRWTLLQVTALSGTTWTSWMRARLLRIRRLGVRIPPGALRVETETSRSEAVPVDSGGRPLLLANLCLSRKCHRLHARTAHSAARRTCPSIAPAVCAPCSVRGTYVER